MTGIIALLACFDQCVDKTTVRQLSCIIQALLTMTGRVTMLGISRWMEKGGSYRTVQRFFAKTLPWAFMIWLFVCHHLLHADHEYVLAGDETVVSKAGCQFAHVNVPAVWTVQIDSYVSVEMGGQAPWSTLR